MQTRVGRIHDGNITPEDPGEQRSNHVRKDTEAVEVHDAIASRPTHVPETHHRTSRPKTSRSHLWWVITQEKANRHEGSGLDAIHT